jgi:hypothetical protein
MDLSQVQSQPQPQPQSESRPRKSISWEERNRRRNEGLCLYCGQPGHMKANCPVAPRPSSPQNSQRPLALLPPPQYPQTPAPLQPPPHRPQQRYLNPAPSYLQPRPYRARVAQVPQDSSDTSSYSSRAPTPQSQDISQTQTQLQEPPLLQHHNQEWYQEQVQGKE